MGGLPKQIQGGRNNIEVGIDPTCQFRRVGIQITDDANECVINLNSGRNEDRQEVVCKLLSLQNSAVTLDAGIHDVGMFLGLLDDNVISKIGRSFLWRKSLEGLLYLPEVTPGKRLGQPVVVRDLTGEMADNMDNVIKGLQFLFGRLIGTGKQIVKNDFALLKVIDVSL